uniref:Polyubiquitin n=1 Tax=Mycena chlorophos TaxID=658473 RepID=A0ABQ0M4K0_MYCCL|nr:polyubiquitin [Mycena chlorophos]
MAAATPDHVYLYCKPYETKRIPTSKMLQQYAGVVSYIRRLYPKMSTRAFKIYVDIDPEDVLISAEAWPDFLAAQQDGSMGAVDEFTVEFQATPLELLESGFRADLILASQALPWTLFVKTLTGQTLRVPTTAKMTVENVKDQICRVKGIPVDQQILVFTGKQLDDTRSLASYGIHDAAVLHFVLRGGRASSMGFGNLPAHPRTSHILLKNSKGECVSFRVSASDTVEGLKERVEDAMGIPSADQRLVYAGADLKDSRTLAQESVRRRATVHLLVPGDDPESDG